MARYIDLGGNFIDTANGYTTGHSEVIIGDYLRKQSGLTRSTGDRDEVLGESVPR